MLVALQSPAELWQNWLNWFPGFMVRHLCIYLLEAGQAAVSRIASCDLPLQICHLD